MQVSMHIAVPPFNVLQQNTQTASRTQGTVGTQGTQGTQSSKVKSEADASIVYVKEHCMQSTQSTQSPQSTQAFENVMSRTSQNLCTDSDDLADLDIESQQEITEIEQSSQLTNNYFLHQHMGLLNINMFGIRYGLQARRARFFSAFDTTDPSQSLTNLLTNTPKDSLTDTQHPSDACENV